MREGRNLSVVETGSRSAIPSQGGHRPRLLLVSSHRDPQFAQLSSREHFERRPYSTAAILYNLEKRGWETARAGLREGLNPFKLARRIDAFRPDIIYTYGSINALMPLMVRKILCRHRTFKVVHGWDDVYGEIWRDVYGKAAGWLMDRMERSIIRRSDAVVTLSLYNQQRGRTWGVESHFIPNGADIPEYDLAKTQIRLEGDFNIVYTGDQARWKRTADACVAMRSLPAGIKLYLTGEHYPYLDEYASDNCIFLGFLPRHEQLCVMAQADALVVTADQECNAKIQEYLRFDKPIVAFDGRPALFFTHERNALLTRDYAAAFRRLAADPDLCGRLVENAAYDLPVDSWAEIAQCFDKFFRELLQ